LYLQNFSYLAATGGKIMDQDAPAGKNTNLEKYCDRALAFGLTHAVVIDPASVVTAAWVRFKCQFGCSHYGETYSCPPHSPDGYYRALALLGGQCTFCKECANLKGEPCTFPEKPRPAMESCGIDVFQTVRNNGFTIEPLREKGETLNLFRMILVD
jgi:predicted metal-binding protein